MAKGVRFRVKRRRRREGITDYTKRLGLLKSGKARLVARISGRKAVAQLIEYNPSGDRTLVNTTSLELKKFGWKGANGNAPASYLTGLLCARKAAKKGIKEAVLDIGRKTPVQGSDVFALLKGAIDGGLKVPHDDSALPPAERISGKLISEYRKVALNFDEVKNKIMSG